MFLCTFLVKWVSSLLIIPFSNTFRVSLQADSGGAKMAFEFLMFKIKLVSLPWLQRTTEEMFRSPIPCRNFSRLKTKTETVFFVAFLLWQDSRCPQLAFVNHRSWWAMVDPQTLCNSLAPRSRPMASGWSYSALLTPHFDLTFKKGSQRQTTFSCKYLKFPLSIRPFPTHIKTQLLQGAWEKLPKVIPLCRCVKFTC